MVFDYPPDLDAAKAPACRLSPDAMHTRGAEWAALRRKYQIDRQQRGQVVRSRWRRAGIDQLQELVVAERECCPFLGFRLAIDEGDRVELETTFPAGVSPDQFAGVG